MHTAYNSLVCCLSTEGPCHEILNTFFAPNFVSEPIWIGYNSFVNFFVLAKLSFAKFEIRESTVLGAVLLFCPSFLGFVGHRVRTWFVVSFTIYFISYLISPCLRKQRLHRHKVLANIFLKSKKNSLNYFSLVIRVVVEFFQIKRVFKLSDTVPFS